MKYFRLAIGLFILLLGNHTSFGQKIEEQIDQVFQEFANQDDFQGAVLVASQGNILYQQAFGLANREWNIPNTVDTKFNLASISKQFTAVLVLQLVDEGRLKLNHTISDYLPEYRRDIGKKVTLHQLLTHQSGIPNYTSIPYVWSDSLYNRYDLEELVEKFVSGDLEFKPGSKYQYSNSGYLLLSMIVEKVTGKPFDQLIEERITRPLALQHTAVDDRQRIISQRAYGYEKTPDGYNNVYSMHMQNLQGAGNLYGTITDLFQWDQALYGTTVLPQKSLQRMMRPYTDANQEWIPPYENRYGYGVGIAKIPLTSQESVDMIFHSGHIRGFSGFYARFPEDGHAIIMLSNTGEVSTARMNQVSLEVVKLLDEQAPAGRRVARAKKNSKASTRGASDIDERDLQSAMYAAWEIDGGEAAVDQYYQLVESFPYDYKNTQQDLSALSGRLAQEGDPESALAVATLNSKVNPHWQTFMEVATINQQLGQKELAAQHYQKALSVNPNRTNAEKEAYQQAQSALKVLL
uniref:Serine hydrolase n=1 Tax=Roseihalotalea indica TaxID=2867963 RepID=A0AA49JIW4_9BACT|nr:serine hydrolase [Tunicatimonas sp. TK19036]